MGGSTIIFKVKTKHKYTGTLILNDRLGGNKNILLNYYFTLINNGFCLAKNKAVKILGGINKFSQDFFFIGITSDIINLLNST